ncbi:hypothetical protein HH308_08255 [Gordonia sp. TBRC 11910]|uniref:N-acetyltransferase domain-containing protein n=1 Tax=Gordonia asplenii TaxID=2725283 RepID=A0A848L0J6_9ACTN|nr:hypothetical protein [Gordonia asplenii]NMO01208.1 hypothetical protein [Gordonia asplenii]
MPHLAETVVRTRFDGRFAMHDRASDTTLVVGTPRSAPDVWRDYIDGAYRSYVARGVVTALEFERVRDGAGTSMFCAAVASNGDVVGGLRVQGPYLYADESHAVEEWAGQPDQGRLVDAIESRLSEGLVEVKSAYVDMDAPHGKAVAGLLARNALITMNTTESRYVMATAADYVLGRWRSGGGLVDESIEPTPYPDSRYLTRVMFWDRYTLAEFAQPIIWAQMRAEFAGLGIHDMFGLNTEAVA